MDPASDSALGGPDLATVVAGMTGNEAFSFLVRWNGDVDWATIRPRVELPDGSRLAFDKRRRSASIDLADGGVLVIDLGRRDRTRGLEAIVTADLVRHDGPEVVVTSTTEWSMDRGDVAVRDPLDRKRKRAATSVPVGPHVTSRWVDADGRTQLLSVGDLGAVSGFGTFLMDGGLSYAHLRTTSGLGCFYDGRRVAFMNAVTDEVVQQARAHGVAQVVTNAGPIGVVVDCGAPGDYLALAAYDRETGGQVAVVVDLRRPPVRDGAIVDPPARPAGRMDP